jgi:hypothetical protein
MSKHSQNKQGFSIVGVLIAAGLMGFLAMLFSQMMTDSLKAKNYLSGAVELENLKSSLMRIIIDPTKCGTAWFDQGGNPARFPVPNANRPARVDYAGSQLLSIGNPIAPGLILDDIRITQTASAAHPSVPGQTTRSVSLVLVASRDQKVSIGANKTESQPITFDFITDNNNSDQIVGCNAAGTGGGTTQTPQQICTALGGTWNSTPAPGNCSFGPPANAQTACENLGFFWNGTTLQCQTDQYSISGIQSAPTSSGLNAGASIQGFKPTTNHVVTIVGYFTTSFTSTPQMIAQVNSLTNFTLPNGITVAAYTPITLQRQIESPVLSGTPPSSRFTITAKHADFRILSISATRATHAN